MAYADLRQERSAPRDPFACPVATPFGEMARMTALFWTIPLRATLIMMDEAARGGGFGRSR